MPIDADAQVRQAVVEVEMHRLKVYTDLAQRFIVDRVKQGPGEIGLDPATGELLGVLSDAALAAKAAIERLQILKGKEDLGWGR